MGLAQQFGTSATKETDGAWFDYPQPDGSIVQLCIARAGGKNSAYKRATRKTLRKFSRSLDVPIEQFEPALDDVCKNMADCILVDWRTRDIDGKVEKKIEDIDGNHVAYTTERAVALLKSLPDLRSDIAAKASDFRNFQDVDLEEIEGN